MNHVQNLPNKNINIAKIDSKLASKTGLPPVKYLPTLMLVKNGVPTTFAGENGEPTTVMPRGNNHSEERETLTNLVQDPNSIANTMANGNMIANGSMVANVPTNNSRTLKNRNTLSSTPGVMTLPTYNKEGSPGRSTVTLQSLAKSPYESQGLDGMPTAEMTENTMFSPIKSTIKASIPVSNPSDIGADLVASQGKAPFTKSTSGGMLDAIREKVNSLNSITRLRNSRRR
jgi:hypothetical protein